MASRNKRRPIGVNKQWITQALVYQENQGFRDAVLRLLESSPIALSSPVLDSSATHPSAHRSPHHQPCHQLTTVVWDLPKANGVALRIRRHAPYTLGACEREMEVTTERGGAREWQRRRTRGGRGEGRSYVDTEAALESLNVIRLKGF